MISFYSDENLPQDLVDALKYLGYDVLTSSKAEQANQSISDAEVLKFALAQKRVLITLNRDDFISLHRQSQKHYGIFICKEDRDYVEQALKIHEFILAGNQSLIGRLIRIKKQNQPGKSAQVFTIQEY